MKRFHFLTSRFHLILPLGIVFWTVLVWSVYLQLEKGHQSAVLSNVIAQLRQDLSMSQPRNLTVTLKDIEDLGLIMCSQLSRLSTPPILLADISIHDECGSVEAENFIEYTFRSVNGSILLLRTLIPLPQIYKLSLIGLFLFGLIVVSGLIYVFRIREIHFQAVNELKLQSARQIAKTAARLAHDLRAPSSALSALSHRLSPLDRKCSQLSLSISNRINEMAESLLRDYRAESETNFHESVDSDDKEESAKFNDVKNLRFRYSLNQTLSLLIDEFRLSRNQPGIRLSFYPLGEDVLNHRISLSELQRSVSNILSNSMESVVESGFVTVEASRSESNYFVTIRDNGCGMSELQCMEALRGKSTKSNGNGIGLSSIAQLLKSVNGDLSVSSQSGNGTQVKLSLPLDSSALEMSV